MTVEDERDAALRDLKRQLRAAGLSDDVSIVMVAWTEGSGTTARKVTLYQHRLLDEEARSRVAEALPGLRITYQERPGL